MRLCRGCGYCAGVRARQEKVVFAMCDDEDVVSEKVRPLLGIA